MTLLLSVITLLLGPFVYSLGQRWSNARQFLDGFVFITIAGIVCVHIVPAALQAGGLLALLFLALGLAFPVALERIFDRAIRQAHRVILLVAALGLVVHAVLDGIALIPEQTASTRGMWSQLWSNQLAFGVILHRLPIGMAIWWSLRPQFGLNTALVIFAIIIAGTATSYVLAGPIVDVAETPSLAFFQSFIAGSLVHVVAVGVSHTHDAHIEPAPTTHAWGYRLGILIGMFIVFAVPQMHAG